MKHSVRMSSYSHGLLMHFLCSNPQMLQLAGIINQHINLEVRSPTVKQLDCCQDMCALPPLRLCAEAGMDGSCAAYEPRG